MHVYGHVRRDSSKRVDEVLEVDEAHVEIILDVNAGQAFNLIDRHIDTADMIRLVDLRHSPVDRRFRIAGNGNEGDLVRLRIDANQHHGVGAPLAVRVHLARCLRCACTRVVSDDQRIEGGVDAVDGLLAAVHGILHQLRVGILHSVLLLTSGHDDHRQRKQSRHRAAANDFLQLHQNHSFRLGSAPSGRNAL